MTNREQVLIYTLITLLLLLAIFMVLSSRNAARANIDESHLKLCTEQLERGVVELQGCERMVRECLEIKR